MKKENPGGFSFFVGVRGERFCKVKMMDKVKSVGAVRNIQTNELHDTGVPREPSLALRAIHRCVAPAESKPYM